LLTFYKKKFIRYFELFLESRRCQYLQQIYCKSFKTQQHTCSRNEYLCKGAAYVMFRWRLYSVYIWSTHGL